MAPIFQPPVPLALNVTTGTNALGGPFGGLQCTDVNLTSAQLLALITTPVTLVVAPGAGLMLIPHVAIIRVLGVTAAYTDVGGAVSLNCGSMSVALAANTVFTGPTAGQVSQQILTFAATSTAANPSTNINAPLTMSKITNNFAAGSGTAHITVYYTTEPAS
jgi:hypothetical protein